jgi:hypothetical protein
MDSHTGRGRCVVSVVSGLRRYFVAQLITVRNNKMAMNVDYLYQGNLPRDICESTNSYFLRGFLGAGDQEQTTGCPLLTCDERPISFSGSS